MRKRTKEFNISITPEFKVYCERENEEATVSLSVKVPGKDNYMFMDCCIGIYEDDYKSNLKYALTVAQERWGFEFPEETFKTINKEETIENHV